MVQTQTRYGPCQKFRFWIHCLLFCVLPADLNQTAAHIATTADSRRNSHVPEHEFTQRRCVSTSVLCGIRPQSHLHHFFWQQNLTIQSNTKQNNTTGQRVQTYKHNGAQIDDAANADAMTPMPFKVSLSTATVLEPQWPVTLLMHGVWRTNHIDGPLGAKITKPAQILLIASESKRLPGKYYDSSALFKLRKMESIKGISVNCVSK